MWKSVGLFREHASLTTACTLLAAQSAALDEALALPTDFSARLAGELEATILAEGPETIAAFIGEPLMGAGGVIVPPRGYWQAIQAVLDRFGILLVADEVICGFGRTGEMFGSQIFSIRPDIMVLSKQLSSSYQPIAAVLVNDRVFEPIADESSRIGVLGHGFTGSGHPVAAAVALENIKIIEERDLVGNARIVGAHLQKRLLGLADHALTGEVRGIGLIAAIELVGNKQSREPWKAAGTLGGLVGNILQDHGVICRNIGDAIALSPPLIITETQIDIVVDQLAAALDIAAREVFA